MSIKRLFDALVANGVKCSFEGGEIVSPDYHMPTRKGWAINEWQKSTGPMTDINIGKPVLSFVYGKDQPKDAMQAVMALIEDKETDSVDVKQLAKLLKSSQTSRVEAITEELTALGHKDLAEQIIASEKVTINHPEVQKVIKRMQAYWKRICKQDESDDARGDAFGDEWYGNEKPKLMKKLGILDQEDPLFEKMYEKMTSTAEVVAGSKSLKQYGREKLRKEMYKEVDRYIDILDDLSDVDGLPFHFRDLVEGL